MGRVKRIWYLSPMRAAKVQASMRMRTVSPEPPLLAHTSSESRRTFRQKARSLAPLNGWTCAVKICQDGMLEDTNSLDSAHMLCVHVYHNSPKFWDRLVWANSADPDQTALRGAVGSVSTLFAILSTSFGPEGHLVLKVHINTY